MVETVAKAQYPRGIDLVADRDPQHAFARSKELIAGQPDAVVFEAAVLWGKLYARIDILRRAGNILHLIEVKSSSIKVTAGAEDDEGDDAQSPFVNQKGKVSSKWQPYLLDVAFQAYLLRKCFPDFEVKPWLCVVNKSHAVNPSETLARFGLSPDPQNPRARPEVTYSGNISDLVGSQLLALREVSAETASLMPEMEAQMHALTVLLSGSGETTRVQEPVPDFYKTCRSCEFRFSAGHQPDRNGFAECWGTMASAQPHILDLHRVTQIGSGKYPDPVPGLLAQGHASLLDLEDGQLGVAGKRRERRYLQWSHSRDGGQEYLPQALRNELRAHQADPGWPLRFVDFEACNVALPHHAGLRPYERVAFQWSCHTLDQQGNLTHAEWLNTERDFPNFTFARTLRQQIGETGTVYVWSHYEQSTLNLVMGQIEKWVRRDPAEALRLSGFQAVAELNDLADWINRLLGPEDAKGKRQHSPRIRDLHKLALEHYFHPGMLGRTSIKVVLPSIWNHSSVLRAHPWFTEYLKLGANGLPLDPYKTLPPLPLGESDEDEEAIIEGTGAIRVYQDLIFRREADPQLRRNRERLLLQYCKLDTCAMVMIWKHWAETATLSPARDL